MRLTLRERLRRVIEDPHSRVREAGVLEGKTVADIGAGRGYFAIAAAEVAGRDALVFAVEPDTEMAESIRRRAEKEGLSNLRILRSTVEDMHDLLDGTLDIAFSFYSFHHFEDKVRALGEVKRKLKDGGTFYIRDLTWNRVIRHGTKRNEVDLLSDAGFSRFELLGLGRVLRARLTK